MTTVNKTAKSKAAKSKTAKVTFNVSNQIAPHVEKLVILGDFNNWKGNKKFEMTKKSDGSFSKTIELATGKVYEYRYLSENGEWFNDSTADAYAPSFYDGFTNCVVDLTNKTASTSSVVSKITTSKTVAAPKAKKTVSTTKITKAATATKKTAAKKTAAKGKDKLTKIEGIGPKIASLLVADGIDTFKKLSTTDVAQLQNILNAAGPRFKMHKPSSWPLQAELASEGKWEELTKLQDKLDGGKF